MLAAKDAVDCLTKKSIQELKSLPQPPKEVLDVAKAIQIMRGDKRNTGWQSAQKMMNNPIKFIEEIQNYNKEEIDDWILKEVEPICALPHFN
jgi:dynein heavy chain